MEILALKSVGGTNTTVVSDLAASVVAAPSTASVDLTDLQTMVAHLATTVATLSKTNRRGDERRSYTDAGGGGGKMDVHPKATTTTAGRTCGIKTTHPKAHQNAPISRFSFTINPINVMNWRQTRLIALQRGRV